MRYNFHTPILNFEQKPMKEGFIAEDKTPQERDVIIGKVIANSLATSNDPDPLKLMSIALKMYNSTAPIELDESDRKKLEAFLEESKQLTNIVRAQALNVLSNPIKDN